MLKPFMPEATQASGVFTGNADVSWDTTKEGLPQGKVTLSGRNVKVTQVVNDAPLPVAFDTLNLSARPAQQSRRAGLAYPPDQQWSTGWASAGYRPAGAA